MRRGLQVGQDDLLETSGEFCCAINTFPGITALPPPAFKVKSGRVALHGTVHSVPLPLLSHDPGTCA